MVKARIERDSNNVHRIIVQRAKFKHWFELGTHKSTTAMFYRHFSMDDIVWEKDRISITENLFKNQSV